MIRATDGSAAAKGQARKKREPDGSIEIEIAGSRVVNRTALARILHVPPPTISAWTKLSDGLPFIRPPSADPNRKGLRMMFDVDVALAWLKSRAEKPNPTRTVRKTSGRAR